MIQMRFLGDEPITDQERDQLGLSDFVELIRMSIQATETPFVYGIFGDWGTGKTSTMRLLAKALTTDHSTSQRFVPIWFNAWLYENEANMVFPLLHAIKKAHGSLVVPPQRRNQFQSLFKAVAATVLTISDLGLRALTKKVFDEAISLEDVKKNMRLSEEELNRIQAVLSTWTDKVSELQETFDQLINTFAENYADAKRVAKEDVVFLILIDDLDRCLPHTTLSILESIKNFLTVDKCVFILGLNPAVVYAGIQHKFLGVNVNGREYLEKIINYSFYVPEPDAARIETFARSRLDELIRDEQTRQAMAARLSAFGEVLSVCRYNNPRKIKRVLNRYLLFLARYQDTLDAYDIKNIVKLIIQAEYYPDLFQIFLSGVGQIDELKKIGTKDFNLATFESSTGVAIAADYAHLRRIHELFRLTDPLKPQVNLAEHAKAVFAIARLK